MLAAIILSSAIHSFQMGQVPSLNRRNIYQFRGTKIYLNLVWKNAVLSGVFTSFFNILVKNLPENDCICICMYMYFSTESLKPFSLTFWARFIWWWNEESSNANFSCGRGKKEISIRKYGLQTLQSDFEDHYFWCYVFFKLAF